MRVESDEHVGQFAPLPGAAAPKPDQAIVAKARAFISYSRADATFAISLCQELEARGIEVLRDVDDTLPGEEWWRRLQSLIAGADAIVFVLSRRSVESKVCRDEVAYGEELKKRIFPAVIEDVDWASVPPGLAARHSVFFKDEAQRAAAVDQLTQALLTDIDWTREHTRLYERAAAWQRQGRGRYELLSGRALQAAEQWLQSQPATAEAPTPLHLEYIKAARDAATRWRNQVMAVLVIGIVLMGGLAGVAAWQRGVAVTERDKATQNFQIARQTAEREVLELARGLRNVRGMSAQTVRKILETAEATFKELAASAPDDLDLQRSRSVFLDEFGDTYVTLGDLDAALKAYHESLAISERLLVADPGNIRRERDLSVSYDRVGDVLVRQGKLQEALKTYRDSLAIRERLVAADPSNTQWQRELSVSHHFVGDVLLKQGKLEEALKAHRDSLAIVERLVAADPSNTQWQYDLSVSYDRVSNVLVKQGKLEEALKAHRDSLIIVARLAAADPSNTEWQRAVSVSHEAVGDVLLAQGKGDEALKAYRDNLAIRERL